MKFKLPKTLFVRLKMDGEDPYHPVAFEALSDAVDKDGPTTVGIYVLQESHNYFKVVKVMDA